MWSLTIGVYLDYLVSFASMGRARDALSPETGQPTQGPSLEAVCSVPGISSMFLSVLLFRWFQALLFCSLFTFASFNFQETNLHSHC